MRKVFFVDVSKEVIDLMITSINHQLVSIIVTAYLKLFLAYSIKASYTEGSQV
jgi:hypothetical protein